MNPSDEPECAVSIVSLVSPFAEHLDEFLSEVVLGSTPCEGSQKLVQVLPSLHETHGSELVGELCEVASCLGAGEVVEAVHVLVEVQPSQEEGLHDLEGPAVLDLHEAGAGLYHVQGMSQGSVSSGCSPLRTVDGLLDELGFDFAKDSRHLEHGEDRLARAEQAVVPQVLVDRGRGDARLAVGSLANRQDQGGQAIEGSTDLCQQSSVCSSNTSL